MNRKLRVGYWAYPIAFGTVILLGHLLGGWVEMDGELDPASMDHQVRSWIVEHRAKWPLATNLARVVTMLGNPEVATTAVVAIALIFFALSALGVGKIRRSEAVFWLFVSAGGRLLSYALKQWFRRERPPLADRLVQETTFSFPSGHAMFAGVSLGLIAMVVLRESTGLNRIQRVVLILAGTLITISVAASRIWLGVHYVSDVLAGFLLGALWAAASIAIRIISTRWHEAHPAHPSDHCNSGGKP